MMSVTLPGQHLNGLQVRTTQHGLRLTYRDGTPVPGVVRVEVSGDFPQRVLVEMRPLVGLRPQVEQLGPLALGYVSDQPEGDSA